MNEHDEKLLQAIEAVKDEASEHYNYWEHAHRGITFPMPQKNFDQVVKPVHDAMTEHPSFAKGVNLFFGKKQLMLHPTYHARILAKIALERGTESVLAVLYKAYETDRTDLRIIAEVYGLYIEGPVKLKNGVHLVSLEKMRFLPNAEAIARQFVPSNAMSSLGTVFPPILAYIDVPDVAGYEHDRRDEKVTDAPTEELLRTVRAFTIADKGTPVIGVHWIDYVDRDLSAMEFGRLWFTARNEGQIPQHNQLKVDDEVLRWVETYIGLQPDLKNKYDVAIERLNLARRRISPGNQAVDGAICLEALLGDQDSQEIGYKIRLRAALLLSDDLKERENIRASVKAFYNLRSKTVHGGVSNKSRLAHDSTSAKDGLSICTRVLQKMVQTEVPIDVAKLELGGGLR